MNKQALEIVKRAAFERCKEYGLTDEQAIFVVKYAQDKDITKYIPTATMISDGILGGTVGAGAGLTIGTLSNIIGSLIDLKREKEERKSLGQRLSSVGKYTGVGALTGMAAGGFGGRMLGHGIRSRYKEEMGKQLNHRLSQHPEPIEKSELREIISSSIFDNPEILKSIK